MRWGEKGKKEIKKERERENSLPVEVSPVMQPVSLGSLFPPQRRDYCTSGQPKTDTICFFFSKYVSTVV